LPKSRIVSPAAVLHVSSVDAERVADYFLKKFRRTIVLFPLYTCSLFSFRPATAGRVNGLSPMTEKGRTGHGISTSGGITEPFFNPVKAPLPLGPPEGEEKAFFNSSSLTRPPVPLSCSEVVGRSLSNFFFFPWTRNDAENQHPRRPSL